MPKFTIVYNNKAINTYDLEDPVITIGRLPENTISIPNMGISRRHIRIERDNNRNYILTDLNSLNGTFVNNKKVKQSQLERNDKISVGKYTIIFEDSDVDAASATKIAPPEDTKQFTAPSTAADIEEPGIIADETHAKKEPILPPKEVAIPATPPPAAPAPVQAPAPSAPAASGADVKPDSAAVLIETNKHVVYKLEKEITTIGNSESDDIFASGFMISQGQVIVEKTKEGTWIRLQKMMGKFKVNGNKVNNVLLQHKDRIEIGSSTFRYMENESE